MKQIIIDGIKMLQPESNNDLLLIGLINWSHGCCVCDKDEKVRKIGYCAKHSSSGKAYLTYFPDDEIKNNLKVRDCEVEK